MLIHDDEQQEGTDPSIDPSIALSMRNPMDNTPKKQSTSGKNVLPEHFDQSSRSTIEIETSYQSIEHAPADQGLDSKHVGNVGNVESKSRFQKPSRTTISKKVSTIETADDLNRLEDHLKNLNGKIVDVTTNINPKNGKKTRIIKIRRKRSKDRQASPKPSYQTRTQNQTPNTGPQFSR